MLASFDVIEARDLDHAVSMAELLSPGTWGGGVEVRQILEPSGAE